MKKFKKLKVLFSLFSIFALLSLTNVNAMEKKEIKNTNIDENMDVHEETKESFDKKDEKVLEKKEKTTESFLKSEHINENLEESTILKNEKEEKKENDESKEKIIITKQELYDLSEKFLKNAEDVNFDNIFQNIFSSFGYSGNKQLKGHPHMFVNPYSLKYKISENGEKGLKDYDKSCIKELFTGSKEMFNNFGPDIIRNFFESYQFCLGDRLDIPITFFAGGKEYSFSREELEYYFKTAIINKQDFKNACEGLVKIFLTAFYLKSFFLNNYADRYSFDYDVREYILRFSKIIFKALKVEFNADGLQAFYLDFNAALDFNNTIERKEDEKMLKRLYDILFNKYERNYVVDDLLYDLYNATSAFLQNKEFWNKMLGFIVASCCQKVREKNYKYEIMERYFSEEYFNFYSEIDKKINVLSVEKNNYEQNNNDEQNFEINFNKDVQDYDFGLPSKSLHKRFKNIFSLLGAKKKKNYFDLLSNEKKYPQKVNEKDDVYLFVKKEPYLKDFSIMELQIVNNLFTYWCNRFQKSFGILFSFDYFIEKFDKLADFENSNTFKLLGHNSLSISDKVMLECSNYAFRNERIKEECFDLIRFMFNFFSTYGFIKFYGNFGNKFDILILELVEYLGNVLDVRFEENKDKKLELKLSFKKVNKDNYFAKKIINVIEKFQNKENWGKATEEEKLVYRLFLTAKSFVDSDYFWNKFISFLVFSNQFMVAKNYSSDKERLYDEYKKVNEEIGKNETFLNSIKSKLDENIINFITGKSCKDIKEVPGFKNEEFVKDYFALRNNKDFLQERFKKNMDTFRKNLNSPNLMLEYSNIINYERYYLRRYGSAFSCGTNESILVKLNKFLNSYEEGKFSESFLKTFYKDFLENKEIANECISLIEKFFYYYMTKLITKCYSKEYDEFLSYFGKGFIESVLKWYVRMFNVKVKDGKLNFNFDLGHFEEHIYRFTGVFASVFNKYKNKADNEKFFQSKEIKERAERFLYSLYVDAFAFLSSEDFWNAFISDLIYKKIGAMKAKKVDLTTDLYKSFEDVLNMMQKKMVEIAKKNKKEEQKK